MVCTLFRYVCFAVCLSRMWLCCCAGAALAVDAIYGNATVIIKQCVFTGNVAQSAGGAISLTLSQVNVSLYSCNFVSNTAAPLMGNSGNGGAIAVVSVLSMTTSVNMCVLSENRASQSGGGLFLSGTGNAQVFLNGTLFQHNNATQASK
jgi:hypothetical protein